MADVSDEEMLAELGATIETKPAHAHTPREERVIAGFEDIVKFYETHGRAPLHGEERDIFERLYAVRLDRLRSLPEFHDLLRPLDAHGLLSGAFTAPPAAQHGGPEEDEQLLAELGVGSPAEASISDLRHVRSQEEKRAADEIANRTPCPDFDRFKTMFAEVRSELTSGIRRTRTFDKTEMALDEIALGRFFVVGGQLAYVAGAEEEFTTDYGRKDRRLRVVYDNGTESNVLARSLQKALHRDDASRSVSDPSAGPLFADRAEPEDLASGTIYVLRSLSDHPFIAANRDLVHKIGVTGGSVEARIAHAANDATYLLAKVEVVGTYKLFNINRVKLEGLFHRLFAPARLDLEIKDRFGRPVHPREWFLAPFSAIDEVVRRLQDGSIKDYAYDPATASLVRHTHP